MKRNLETQGEKEVSPCTPNFLLYLQYYPFDPNQKYETDSKIRFINFHVFYEMDFEIRFRKV